MNRAELISELAAAVVAIERPHPVRVAVDGVGASGKTVLADELALELGSSGREIIRAGVDGFHRPRAERHRRGSDSPEGYYRDSFDYAALVSVLLDPMGPGGNRIYRTAVFDFRTDSPVDVPVRRAGDTAILVFDGVFILRPELRGHWDFSIFVDTGFDVTVERALSRDLPLFGSKAAVRERYLSRYVPGEKIYLAEARPAKEADAVVRNDNPLRPVLKLEHSECGEKGTA